MDIRKLARKYTRCKAKGSFKSLSSEDLLTLADHFRAIVDACLPFQEAEATRYWATYAELECRDLHRRRTS